MRTVKARVMEHKIITPRSQYKEAFMEYRIRIPFANVNGIKCWGSLKVPENDFKNQADIRRCYRKSDYCFGLIAYPKQKQLKEAE